MLSMLWLTIATILVVMMQAGFCCLESGLVRSRNSISVAIKNVSDFCLCALLFWLFGYGLLYGPSWGGWIGTGPVPFTAEMSNPRATVGFLFDLVFCGTATTIASGVIAERMRFRGYLVLSALIAGLIYPIFGHWAWAGTVQGSPAGWLAQLGFVDFAGSTVVHCVGAWSALAAAMLIGPRAGAFRDGVRQPMRSTSVPLAAVGVLLLWIGWFGFNGGSARTFDAHVPAILLNTLLAGAAGGMAMLALELYRGGTLAVEIVLNGILAGLVAVTAGCHAVSAAGALAIGLGGALVMRSAMRLLERRQIDDVVQAIPAHGFAGLWGTLAVPLFAAPDALATGLSRWQQLGVQILGSGTCFVWSFGTAWCVLRLVNRRLPLRVSADEEQHGLNIVEHGSRSDVEQLVTVMKNESCDSKSMSECLSEFSELCPVVDEFTQAMDATESALREAESARSLLESERAELLIARKQLEQKNRELAGALEKLKTTQAELLQAEKLAAVGQLASGIAHEINTPIQFVGDNLRSCSEAFDEIRQLIAQYRALLPNLENDQSYAERIAEIRRLEERIELDYLFEDVPQAFQDSLEGIDRVRQIVLAMKDFSRAGCVDESVEFNVNELLKSTLTVAHNEYKYVAEVQTDFDEVPNTYGYPGELNQVFLNMIINAVHAIRDRKEPHNGPGRITIRTRAEADGVVISIGDNGCGIPESVRHRIFEPFFTTKDVGKGTGQGLAISHRIVVDRHGGRIDLETEEGVGTTFHIFLPARPPAVKQPFEDSDETDAAPAEAEAATT